MTRILLTLIAIMVSLFGVLGMLPTAHAMSETEASEKFGPSARVITEQMIGVDSLGTCDWLRMQMLEADRRGKDSVALRAMKRLLKARKASIFEPNELVILMDTDETREEALVRRPDEGRAWWVSKRILKPISESTQSKAAGLKCRISHATYGYKDKAILNIMALSVATGGNPDFAALEQKGAIVPLAQGEAAEPFETDKEFGSITRVRVPGKGEWWIPSEDLKCK